MMQLIIGFLVLSAIVGVVVYIVVKAKIAIKMKTDPAAAVRLAQKSKLDSLFTKEEYVKQLEKIANEVGYVGAMQELVKFYKDESEKKKIEYWSKRAAEAGDLKCIIEYYGFSDYDVKSDQFEDILRALNAARTAAPTAEHRDFANYYCGVVNYKMGQFNAAGKLFAAISYSGLVEPSNYMSFKCFLRENNISEAEKMLDSLEKGGHEISADDYLALYDYYVRMRESGCPNYAAESKYADRYSASKGADRKTANKIGGSTYYSIAVGLEQGINGFQKDIKKALKAYEKAADYENAEAQYYLGEGQWSGRLLRNYSKANDLLSKAARQGHKGAKEILQEYGVDGILVRTMQEEERTYHFLDGYTFIATRNTAKWLQLQNGISYKAWLLVSEFRGQYRAAFNSFDQMINGVHQLYSAYIAQMLGWGLKLLMSYDIDTYDGAAILSECEDLSLLPRVPKVERGLERIDSRAAELKLHLSYTQATRGYWRGAGFGTTISSTVANAAKASVAAGAMNIGSGILHGIGDGIVKAMNNSEINGMGKKLFADPATAEEFANAVGSACSEIGRVVLKLLMSHCHIQLEIFGPRIVFNGETLADIDDRALKAKISNNLAAEKYEYAYALLIEALRRFPLNEEVFKQVMMLTMQRNKSFAGEEYDSILKYVADFQIDVSDIADALLDITNKK